MKKLYTWVLVGLVVAGLWGCGEAAKTDQSTSAAPSAPANTQALPAGLILKEAPPDAKAVGVAKKEAKEGDEIVIRGMIGGRKEVFTPGRATFVIADTKLPACSMKPGDKCETPWDLCCETPETLQANTATIQVSDESGKPVKSDLRGFNGIDHLSVVVVKGKVAKREEQNLVVNATGIYVEKPAAPAAH